MKKVLNRYRFPLALLGLALLTPFVFTQTAAGITSGVMIFIAAHLGLTRVFNQQPWATMTLADVAPKRAWFYIGIVSALHAFVVCYVVIMTNGQMDWSWHEVTTMTFWFLVSMALLFMASGVAVMQE